jgi:hypothetical protein
MSCHDQAAPGTAGGGSDKKVDRHFSDTYNDPTTGVLVDIKCVECHNPMRTQYSFLDVMMFRTNLAFIRTTVRGNDIAFEAYTGNYSFGADASAVGDMNWNNYICNACHTNTNHHQADGTAPG